jgi:membrane-associated phospholipid phosphatase
MCLCQGLFRCIVLVSVLFSFSFFACLLACWLSTHKQVGYLRPVFLDICRPYYDESDADFRCVNDDPEGRISFPSNHSGWSFCGMLLLSMYLERCFGGSSSSSSTATKPATTKEAIFRERNRQALGRLVSLACYAPVLVAVFVAASRVADNRHFPADVIGGAVLGGSVASLVFGIWFPEP